MYGNISASLTCIREAIHEQAFPHGATTESSRQLTPTVRELATYIDGSVAKIEKLPSFGIDHLPEKGRSFFVRGLLL